MCACLPFHRTSLFRQLFEAYSQRAQATRSLLDCGVAKFALTPRVRVPTVALQSSTAFRPLHALVLHGNFSITSMPDSLLPLPHQPPNRTAHPQEVRRTLLQSSPRAVSWAGQCYGGGSSSSAVGWVICKTATSMPTTTIPANTPYNAPAQFPTTIATTPPARRSRRRNRTSNRVTSSSSSTQRVQLDGPLAPSCPNQPPFLAARHAPPELAPY